MMPDMVSSDTEGSCLEIIININVRKDDQDIAGEGAKLLKTLSFQAELSTVITKWSFWVC